MSYNNEIQMSLNIEKEPKKKKLALPAEVVDKIKKAFPKMFVNELNEAIIEPHSNVYFRLEACKDEKDVMVKIIEWCSRLKEISTVRKMYLLNGINHFCGTNFSLADMHDIYRELGNGVNHEKTIAFVDSDFNMNLIDRTIPSWFKGGQDEWKNLIEKE